MTFPILSLKLSSVFCVRGPAFCCFKAYILQPEHQVLFSQPFGFSISRIVCTGGRGPGENINGSSLGDRMAVGCLRDEGRDSLGVLDTWNDGQAMRRNVPGSQNQSLLTNETWYSQRI